MVRAFITGITGQDGSYLVEHLLHRKYEVHGFVRPGTDITRTHLADHANDIGFHEGDLTDRDALERAVSTIAPDEVYHLAAQSHVGHSFEAAEETLALNGMATVSLLEIIRLACPKARFLNAASSEIFGRPETTPQDETTPLAPVNPYGCAKALGTQMTRLYREAHAMFMVNAILYNHESPRRPERFVPQKICRAAAAIKLGQQKELRLGDLSAERDWSDARDIVRGLWLALQHHRPDDFIFASGEAHTVQEIVEIAFETVDIDWKKHVKRDQSLLRPAEPNRLVGNPRHAWNLLDWQPETDFRQLIIGLTHAALRELNC